MLNYRPLVYMWIAEYEGGKALPQFDPHTGEENKFSDVTQNKLVRFGWFPFTFSLAEKIHQKTGLVVIPSNNPPHIIKLKKNSKLIAKRENTIKFNPKTGGISREETTYLLGEASGKVLRIKEDGTLDGKRI